MTVKRGQENGGEHKTRVQQAIERSRAGNVDHKKIEALNDAVLAQLIDDGALLPDDFDAKGNLRSPKMFFLGVKRAREEPPGEYEQTIPETGYLLTMSLRGIHDPQRQRRAVDLFEKIEDAATKAKVAVLDHKYGVALQHASPDALLGCVNSVLDKPLDMVSAKSAGQGRG